jgi:hypothetical protein
MAIFAKEGAVSYYCIVIVCFTSYRAEHDLDPVRQGRLPLTARMTENRLLEGVHDCWEGLHGPTSR